MAKTITWNGITDGLVTIDTNVWVASMVSFYKVSDEVFTEQDFDGATFVCSDGTEYNVDSFDDYGDGVVVAKSRIISGNAGTYNKVSWNSYYITLPSDGTYFAVVNPSSDHTYVASATFPNVEDTKPTLTARDLYRKINGQPVKLTLYKKLGGELVALDEYTQGGNT